MRRARQEAVQIVVAWAVCLVWTVGYCALVAYGEGPVRLVAGMPAWVLGGIAIPWLAATVFSVWFALRRIKDESA